MTKKEAVEEFKRDILPHVIERYGKNDKPACREAWNNYTDALCKSGLITQYQYNSWLHPF